MTDHPYTAAPDYRRWSRSVARHGVETDPVLTWPWRLSPADKVAAAGSCFAQHVTRYLKAGGFNFLNAEQGHPVLGPTIAKEFGYDVYSARFGNIYTSRQLLQLLRRAFGRYKPTEDVWELGGRWFDPYRPALQPSGYASLREFECDRAQHFSAVRRMFRELQVFVLTIGLSETWIARDGTAFPVCPGTVAGEFDAARHSFLNLSYNDVVGDLTDFVAELRGINPSARIVLTVSPVPLAATAEDRHVLVSTMASKSILRAACEEVCRLEGVDYFPSYEIIMGPHARGRWFADDLRSVTEDGVRKVMNLFFRHVAGVELQEPQEHAEQPDDFRDSMRKIVAVMCDEEMLDPADGDRQQALSHRHV